MSVGGQAPEHFIRAFNRFAAFGEKDQKAIRDLPIVEREIVASAYIVREGQQPKRCALLLDGFVYRQKLTANGQRAIVGLQVPGNFIDLQNLFLRESDHDVLALTRIVVAEMTIEDLRQLVSNHPAINQALWIGGLVEASIFREWLLNVGRRDAALPHLICSRRGGRCLI